MKTRSLRKCGHCSVELFRGVLRLRWRFNRHRYSKTLVGCTDTKDNRRKARELADAVTARLRAGIDPRPSLGMQTELPKPLGAPGLTVEAYYRRWIDDRDPHLRKAQKRDYRKHIEKYVLPRLGSTLLTELTPRDLAGLQSELLTQRLSRRAMLCLPHHSRDTARGRRKGGPRTLSPKYVKNIIAGSFRAMIRDAKRIDGVEIRADLFGGLDWKRTSPPGAEPFTPEERDRILAWFKTKTFGLGRIGGENQARVHLPYYGYLHLLFWTGMRPSEAAGLQWGDIDLNEGTANVERSWHLGEMGETKTVAARRIVELAPDTVAVLRQMMPVRVEPDMPVFTNLDRAPIEPNSVLPHWYRCLRAVGVRVRGLYATKDTFVSLAMTRNVNPAWLEQQTGVAWATLKRHYGKYMRRQGKSEMELLLDKQAPERRSHNQP